MGQRGVAPKRVRDDIGEAEAIQDCWKYWMQVDFKVGLRTGVGGVL